MAIQKVDRNKNKHLLKVLPRKAPLLVKRNNKSIREQLQEGKFPASYYMCRHYFHLPYF